MNSISRARFVGILLLVAIVSAVFGGYVVNTAVQLRFSASERYGFDALLRDLDSGTLPANLRSQGKPGLYAEYRETPKSELYHVEGYRNEWARILLYCDSKGPYAAQGLWISPSRQEVWWFKDDAKLAEHTRLSAEEHRKYPNGRW